MGCRMAKGTSCDGLGLFSQLDGPRRTACSCPGSRSWGFSFVVDLVLLVVVVVRVVLLSFGLSFGVDHGLSFRGGSVWCEFVGSALFLGGLDGVWDTVTASQTPALSLIVVASFMVMVVVVIMVLALTSEASGYGLGWAESTVWIRTLDVGIGSSLVAHFV